MKSFVYKRSKNNLTCTQIITKLLNYLICQRECLQNHDNKVYTKQRQLARVVKGWRDDWYWFSDDQMLHLYTVKQKCICVLCYLLLYVCVCQRECLTLQLLVQGPSDSPGWAAAGCLLAPSARCRCWAGRGALRWLAGDASGRDAACSSDWLRGWCF